MSESDKEPSKIYKAWQGLPPSMRRPFAAALQKVGIRMRLLDLVNANPQKDFFTLTPETPPAILKCMQKVAELGLAGDYYEFGMYRGYTFWSAQDAAKRAGLSGMRFFGFDSFAGLPQPAGIDVHGDEFKEGDYACSYETVRENLDENGVDWSRTQLIRGYFDKSLKPSLKTEHRMQPVAVALIDCDLYHSTVDVLNFLSDLLQEGSILMFDDWNCFDGADDKGERRAFREYLEQHPKWQAEAFVSFGWHGQSFILHRNS